MFSFRKKVLSLQSFSSYLSTNRIFELTLLKSCLGANGVQSLTHPSGYRLCKALLERLATAWGNTVENKEFTDQIRNLPPNLKDEHTCADITKAQLSLNAAPLKNRFNGRP